MRIGAVGILIILLASACMEDFNREYDTVYYKPFYSIPIGPLDYTLGVIMPYSSLTPIEIDTSITPDTIPLLLYDDSLFFINPPNGHDTAFYYQYNFSAFSDESEYTRSLMIRVNYSNGLPLDMNYQLYFYDENNGLLDSLFEDGSFALSSASVDENGFVIDPFTGREERDFDSLEIATILQTRRFEIAIHLDTYEGAPDILPIYSNYAVNFELAMRAGLIIPIE